MLSALLTIGGIGLIAGFGLAVASKIFYVYVDPKIVAVEDVLPGANCGGCGFPGCSGAAAAIVAGQAAPNICVAGGSEVHAHAAAIMGVEVSETEPEIALPGCTYGVDSADRKYVYDGFNDCRAAVLLDGGSKVCPIGCIGLGTCSRACPFGALSMGPDHLPVVNKNLCTGCGTCERVCPKHIITLSSNSLRVLNEYTTDACTAPCQRACPAGIDIPSYIKAIAEGNYLEAVRIIKETNPFPAVCGRICVHPCEFECRRNLVDEAVAINHLKRFATDMEIRSGQHVQITRAPATGMRVAVIGGGAEGLTAAYFLNRLGHEATVFEATSKLGGLLRAGLPENRLPRDVLDHDVKGIMDAGVEVLTEKRLGQDFSVGSLLEEGYAAVLIATGGWDTQLQEREKGEKVYALENVRLLIDFLLDYQSGQATKPGRHVMISGAGKTALEAARIWLDAGAEKVYIVSRKPEGHFSALRDALSEAEKESVLFFPRTALTKLTGRDNELTHVEMAALSANGEQEGGRMTLKVDRLLFNAGRLPEFIYFPQKGESDTEEGSAPEKNITWEAVVPYAGPSADQELGIFRPGEVVSDYKAVVEAIGAGRRTANSVHRLMRGDALAAPEKLIRKNTAVLSLTELEPVSAMPRHPMPEHSAEELTADPSVEIAKGYSEEAAVGEAKRCLKCGLICYRRVEGDLH